MPVPLPHEQLMRYLTAEEEDDGLRCRDCRRPTVASGLCEYYMRAQARLGGRD